MARHAALCCSISHQLRGCRAAKTTSAIATSASILLQDTVTPVLRKLLAVWARIFDVFGPKLTFRFSMHYHTFIGRDESWRHIPRHALPEQSAAARDPTAVRSVPSRLTGTIPVGFPPSLLVVWS
jgi:hypothetical protein